MNISFAPNAMVREPYLSLRMSLVMFSNVLHLKLILFAMCVMSPRLSHAQDCIHTKRLCCESPVISNAFTPNGDGVNDYLEVFNASEFTLKIFNRWGEKVYEGERWDGTHHGKRLTTDTFVYTLITCDGQLYFGSVLLLR